MRSAKRAASVFLALVFLAAACGKAEVAPEATALEVAESTEETTEEPTTEESTVPPTTKHYDPPMPPEVPPKHIATMTYAVSDTHFYGIHIEHLAEGNYERTLLRTPLNNILKYEEVPLPKSYEGDALGHFQICGLTDDWLFVNFEGKNRFFATYRISVKDFTAELLDYSEASFIPWYNAGSNSLLFGFQNTINDHFGIKLEALQLDTKQRTEIFDGTTQWFAELWSNTADGLVALETSNDWPHRDPSSMSSVLIIDKDNRVVPTTYNKVNFKIENDNLINQAEQLLKERDENEIVTFTTCGNYVYYVEDNRFNGEPKNLFRMRIDGSERKLLREKTNIYRLITVQSKLFCLADRPVPAEITWDYFPGGLYALDADGKITKIIAHFQDYDSVHLLERIGNFVLLKVFGIYSTHDGHFHTLYDPATGAVFSSGR